MFGNGKLVGDAVLPSIMVYALNPSLGAYIDPTNSTAAVNLCARKLYTQLSNKSGRTATYGPQDVMTAILGMGEVISMISYIRRIFGIVFTYNQRNRDLPKHLINAMGVNPDDLFSNLAAYRVRYNTVVNTANKIPVPANIAWFSKCDALYQGVYKDTPDDMAELYAFVPGSTWQLDEAYEGGSRLITIPWAAAPDGGFVSRNLSVYITTLQQMIDALLTSSTLNIIYADIINYSNNSNVPLLHLAITDELYSVVPQYDEEVLLHIHNMQVTGVPSATSDNLEDAEVGLWTKLNDVVPSASNNNLCYMPIFELPGTSGLEAESYPGINSICLVDFPYGNPDLTQRIEATRFSARFSDQLIAGPSGSTNKYLVPTALADHYCTVARLFVDGNSWITSTALKSIAGTSFGVSSLCGMEKFRYHHLQYRLASDYSTVKEVSGELNYFTELDSEWLSRLNSLCFQGLFELR